MAVAFESSLSSSMSRLHAPAVGQSIADTLPDINFGFDELRERMAKFTVRFDAFIEQGRKRVLEERNQFRMNIAELQEDQRMKKKDIEILQHKAHAHQQTVAKEAAETREMQSTIAALTAQRDRTIAARDDLAAQIAATQKQIEARLAAQRQRRQQLSRQARHNLPELDFWVTRLCLRIDKGSSGGGDVDRLKFIYDHVDEKDWAREVWFELDMSARDYRVVACRPRLDGAKVDAVVAKLNETRELVVLLKGMRELFVEAVKA